VCPAQNVRRLLSSCGDKAPPYQKGSIADCHLPTVSPPLGISAHSADNRGMIEQQIEQLKSLPKRPKETWQGGLARMPGWITGEGPKPYRPFLPIWIAVRDDKVHSANLLRPEECTPAAAVESLLEFALEDKFGGYRPGRLEVADSALAEHLTSLLAETDIEVRLVERLDAVNQVLDEMARFQADKEIDLPGPLDGEGVSIERMRRFADAAAAFYRAAPWQYVTDADLIRVEEPQCPSGMEYATVLGAGRAVFGLGFYRSVADYAGVRRGASEGHPEGPPSPGIWQLSFEPITGIPPQDADLWEDHDLPVAGERAYPMAMHFGPRRRITRPSAAQLAFLEAVLRTLSTTTEPEIDSGHWHKDVETSDGTIRVTLAIPDLLEPPSFEEWLERGFEPDRRAHEQMFADMNRYFEQHPPADMDEMNAVAQSLFSGKKFDERVTRPETPLEQAQELCYEAFNTHGRRRVQLARQALEICPDCADAHVILAEQSGTPEAELDHYRRGTAAGERALGPEAFEEDVGHFWGMTATRPYMRARFGLAQTLEQLGRLEEAVEHYQELLRLNPNDNQGVRYLLMPRLLELGRDVEAARLLKDSEEESANWAYAQALLAFRLSGTTTAARRELRTAFRANAYVPEYLLQEGPFPTPYRYSLGSREEAIIAAGELRPAFQRTEGAIEWLAAQFKLWEKDQRSREKRERLKERERLKGRQRRKKRKGR